MQLPLVLPHVGGTVQDDAAALQRHDPATDHRVQLGEGRLDRLLGLPHLDDERQIERQPQHLLRVDHARGAVPRDPPQHSSAGQPLLAELLEQRLIQRFAVVLVALADENAHQGALALESMRHMCSPLPAHSSLLASAVPTMTAPRHPMIVPPMYNPAYQYSPSPSSLMLS